MISGERVIRKFAERAQTEELYAFVECYDTASATDPMYLVRKPEGYEHRYKFRLVSPMPRVVYDVEARRTIGETIGRNANLIVEPIDEEDGDV